MEYVKLTEIKPAVERALYNQKIPLEIVALNKLVDYIHNRLDNPDKKMLKKVCKGGDITLFTLDGSEEILKEFNIPFAKVSALLMNHFYVEGFVSVKTTSPLIGIYCYPVYENSQRNTIKIIAHLPKKSGNYFCCLI